MIKIVDLINETEFKRYQAMIRVTYSPDATINDISDYLRAIPGVLTIVQVTHDYQQRFAILKAKILSSKNPKDAYDHFKSLSVKKIPQVKKIEIAKNTIEIK
jgi:hypothetical protein